MRQRVGILVALALALCVSACGDDAQPEPDVRPASQAVIPSESSLDSNIVTESQVKRQPATSPQRSLLRWWQAIQYQDTATVVDLTELRVLNVIGRERVGQIARAVGPALPGLQVIATTTQGAEARSRVAILTYKDGEVDRRSTLPYTFQLIREQGVWKVNGLRYLRVLTRSFRIQ